jgi:formylglycine-generating enzyme required for sulfatase activity
VRLADEGRLIAVLAQYVGHHLELRRNLRLVVGRGPVIWEYAPVRKLARDGRQSALVMTVHIAYADAQAYARWAGKSLPTEAEWEFAARGGIAGAMYAWGNELTPQGRMLANYWQGEFPWENTRADGYDGTSPVRVYPCNGFGLYDMIGNVWEWTVDWYGVPAAATACCTGSAGRAPTEAKSYDPATPNLRIGRKVVKGARSSARPVTASAIVPPRNSPSLSTARPRTWASAVSSASRALMSDRERDERADSTTSQSSARRMI